MDNKSEEKRCKSCGKLLLDDNVTICPRCKLETKKGVMKAGKVAAHAAGIGAVGAAIIGKADPKKVKKAAEIGVKVIKNIDKEKRVKALKMIKRLP